MSVYQKIRFAVVRKRNILFPDMRLYRITDNLLPDMWLDSVSVFHLSELSICESGGYDNELFSDSNTHRLEMHPDFR